MADRPSWWDQVKEVDREEAEVLFRLGLPVWFDWPYGGSIWSRMFRLPVTTTNFNCAPEKGEVYYTEKGEALG